MAKVYSILRTIITSILLSILLTLLLGYVVGFRMYIVNGWSSEPDIPYNSIVLDYRSKYEDLHVGDYITFGKETYTTHVIVAKCGEGDYKDKTSFSYGEEITFENMGITFSRSCSLDGATIVTMTNNKSSYADLVKKYSEGGINAGQTCSNEGPSAEFNTYSNISGRVIYILPTTGKILIYVKNNFYQLVFYVIILYVGAELLRFSQPYSKTY